MPCQQPLAAEHARLAESEAEVIGAVGLAVLLVMPGRAQHHAALAAAEARRVELATLEGDVWRGCACPICEWQPAFGALESEGGCVAAGAIWLAALDNVLATRHAQRMATRASAHKALGVHAQPFEDDDALLRLEDVCALAAALSKPLSVAAEAVHASVLDQHASTARLGVYAREQGGAAAGAAEALRVVFAKVHGDGGTSSDGLLAPSTNVSSGRRH